MFLARHAALLLAVLFVAFAVASNGKKSGGEGSGSVAAAATVTSVPRIRLVDRSQRLLGPAAYCRGGCSADDVTAAVIRPPLARCLSLGAA